MKGVEKLLVKSLDILRYPIVSEKASLLRESNVYTFRVSDDATKKTVKQAVEHVFAGAKVVSVNMLNVRPEKKLFKGRLGQVSGYKKAYVRLESKLVSDLVE